MVITNVNQVVYQGDGVTTAFPFTFTITDASEVYLQLVHEDDTVTAITQDFYVDVTNNTVHYPGYAPGSEPPEANRPPKVQAGEKLVIYRDVPMTQEINLGDKWPFSQIEFGLDKLTMICQQIYSYTNRKLDAALASMFQLAGIVTDSDKLQHITDQFNAIDENAAAAAESEDNAAASEANALSYKNAAATSATNASNSASSASTTATQLMAYLADKETLTAPAVDPTLTISGAAADAKLTGDKLKDVEAPYGRVIHIPIVGDTTHNYDMPYTFAEGKTYTIELLNLFGFKNYSSAKFAPYVMWSNPSNFQQLHLDNNYRCTFTVSTDFGSDAVKLRMRVVGIELDSDVSAPDRYFTVVIYQNGNKTITNKIDLIEQNLAWLENDVNNIYNTGNEIVFYRTAPLAANVVSIEKDYNLRRGYQYTFTIDEISSILSNYAAVTLYGLTQDYIDGVDTSQYFAIGLKSIVGNSFSYTVSSDLSGDVVRLRLYMSTPSGSYTSDINVTLDIYGGTEIDRLERQIINYDTVNYLQFHLPWDLRYCEELPYDFYGESVQLGHSAGSVWISGNNGIHQVTKQLETTDIDNGTYDIFVNGGTQSYEVGRPFTVSKSAADNITNKTPTMIFVGDSLIHRDIATNTNLNLANSLGVTATFEGTMNNGATKGEGREGWTYANFIGLDTLYPGNLEIEVQSTKGTSSVTKNPFLTLATADDKTDHPTWCFTHTAGGANEESNYQDAVDKTQDFYIFNFANYLQVQEIDTPDIVLIAAGRNDVAHYPSGYLAECSLALEIMITSIKQVAPNCKIIVVPAPVQTYENQTFYERLMNWHEEAIKVITDTLSSYTDIYILSMHAFMPRRYVFGRKDPDADTYSDVNLIKYDVLDYTHWNTAGKYMYARVLASYIGTLL